MTPEPSVLAMEERLQRLASAMPSPDVDAGWAALAAMLEPPVAPVIYVPRRRSFGRLIMLVAAAILVAGAAFAAVRQRADTVEPASPAAGAHSVIVGPHLHGAFTGPPAPASATGNGTARRGTGSATNPSDGGTTRTSGGQGGERDHTKTQDDPNDLDQGTGNDGQHNDHGGGNNGTEGSRTTGSGRGNGRTSGGHDAAQPKDHPGSGGGHGEPQGQANGHDK